MTAYLVEVLTVEGLDPGKRSVILGHDMGLILDAHEPKPMEGDTFRVRVIAKNVELLKGARAR